MCYEDIAKLAGTDTGIHQLTRSAVTAIDDAGSAFDQEEGRWVFAKFAKARAAFGAKQDQPRTALLAGQGAIQCAAGCGKCRGSGQELPAILTHYLMLCGGEGLRNP